jgi:translation initiation factor IF-3
MNRTPKIRVNGDLRGTPNVRVIGHDGAMLGVMTLADTLRAAMAQGLDLVEVNPQSEPPACRILDFRKYSA